MIRGTANWRERIEDARPGDHFLLLSDHPPSTDRVYDAFVRGGLRRRDLIAFVFPSSEFTQLRTSLGTAGHDVDTLIAREDLLIVPAQDWQPEDPADERAIATLLEALLDLATARGKSGLTYVGRIAPHLLERGDAASALLIERSFHSLRGTARVLCPYDTRGITLPRIAEMYPLLQCHTHTITALPGDGFLVETSSSSAAR